MSDDQKIEEIKKFCLSVIENWDKKSTYDDYQDGKSVGRGILAETILDIINGSNS